MKHRGVGMTALPNLRSRKKGEGEKGEKKGERGKERRTSLHDEREGGERDETCEVLEKSHSSARGEKRREGKGGN